MRIRTAIALLAGSLATTMPGMAEERRSAAFDACMDASEGVTAAMMDCIGAEIDRADGVLNRLWQAKLPSLAPAAKAALRREQRAWIRRRDETCRAENGGTDPFAGTAAAVGYADCVLEQTLKRTRELRRIFRQASGPRPAPRT